MIHDTVHLYMFGCVVCLFWIHESRFDRVDGAARGRSAIQRTQTLLTEFHDFVPAKKIRKFTCYCDQPKEVRATRLTT